MHLPYQHRREQEKDEFYTRLQDMLDTYDMLIVSTETWMQTLGITSGLKKVYTVKLKDERQKYL